MNFFMNVSQLIFELGGTGSVAKKLQIQSSTISNWKKNNKIPDAYSVKIYSLLSQTQEIQLQKNIIERDFNNVFTKSKQIKILLIISGGVASYKMLELIRLLKKINIEIDIILTKSAQKFINPLLITSLNGKECFTELFSEDEDNNMNHIKLARNNDLVIVAPATANILGKLANGLADDLASNVLLATTNKILLAPSMNPMMWLNPATQKNIKVLRDRGIDFIEPEQGSMACGEEGIGRLPDLELISKQIIYKISEKINLSNEIPFIEKKLHGLKILITAGPTQEKIDPIRFISNNSSGKQGYAIAEEFEKKGANVTLISGPTNLNVPKVDKFINITTAEEMLEATLQNLPTDIFISTAAVADWKLVPYDLKNSKINSKNKIKKNHSNDEDIIFKCKNNPDILNIISKHKNRPGLVIGFAAETNNLIDNAKLKLKNKNLDFIIANKISNENKVFGNDINTVSIVEKKSIESHIQKSKHEIANIIIKKITNHYL